MPNDPRIVRQITQRLSLRAPQEHSLEILADVVNELDLGKNVDLQEALCRIQATYPTVTDFERDFPSLCFALATGVGKTRLMGAFVSFLYLTERSRNFFVLAPNTTIYDKLIQDFTPGTAKYVFKGIAEFALNPPILVTGENWDNGRGVQGTDLFGNTPIINIFNVDKINKDKGRIKKLQEYIGESYFDYLAGLPDLVLLMDEAHRYRAKAGMKAVAELKPVLGLELTATPKTVGTRSDDFKNVIFDYGLGNAMADGFVKEPAVATRANFRPDSVTPEQLEQIKLEDGIHYHEYVKVELDIYARDTGQKKVHPFMLVVAQDTEHAKSLRERIESDAFFGGRYKGRVAEVHSALKGDENDEAMARLVALETDGQTDVVIHVNKLKEGWDVTNLYTIVPLRASASDILTEQTLGRGLRLPYGKRTGVEAVDTLTVIAHDRFDDVIRKAREDDSPFKIKKVTIGDGSDVSDKGASVLESPSTLDTLLTGAKAGIEGTTEKEADTAPPLFTTPSEQRAAQATVDLIQHQYERKLKRGFQELGSAKIKGELAKAVREAIKPAQGELEGIGEEADVEKIVEIVTSKIIELTIEIPEIVVIPTREVTFGFNDFDLTGLEAISKQPISDEILITNMRTDARSFLARAIEGASEEMLENYIVRHLIEFDQVDYDSQSDLLYKLAGQMVARVKSYLSVPEDVENVCLVHGKELARFIFEQMKANYWETPTDYRAQISRGFQVLRPQNFNVSDPSRVKPFTSAVTPLSDTKKHVFTGFKKCCYPFQKFDSDDERRFAVLIDSDHEPSVIRWMKPGAKQFQIEYLSGKGYEPDFVVETDKEKLIVEVKARKDMTDEVVMAKARAACEWVKHANDHAQENGGKLWQYALVPDDEIRENSTLAGLMSAHGRT
ncbi:DEAD/DEAH box helicase family protein [Henriciella sp.]|uniref:DEAD/DEAH box helicase n=1 Tax=Henriciella sp. TaxID=1968823 RepID=UPI0017DF9663|nr:DEAD/DEAH box helicase family protein [Henriciella sp.]HIG23695.1 restriction endonuclease subunit R [Henriciella sp.]